MGFSSIHYKIGGIVLCVLSSLSILGSLIHMSLWMPTTPPLGIYPAIVSLIFSMILISKTKHNSPDLKQYFTLALIFALLIFLVSVKTAQSNPSDFHDEFKRCSCAGLRTFSPIDSEITCQGIVYKCQKLTEEKIVKEGLGNGLTSYEYFLILREGPRFNFS